MSIQRLFLPALVLPLGFGVLVDCNMSDAAFGGLTAAACPELSSNVDPLSASFSANAEVNGKVRAFVAASRDLMGLSAAAENEATQACLRIGADLGLTPAQQAPREGPGGRVKGACEPVAARMDAVLRQGLRFQVSVTPPRCQANTQAQARCQGTCSTNNDAECNASCRAHGEFHATCTPIQVVVRPSVLNPQALRLAASLQANLPALLHAEWVLGKRVLRDVDVVVRVGKNLPKVVGKAGAHALACIAAASSATVRASVSIKVTVQASASVSGRAGVAG